MINTVVFVGSDQPRIDRGWDTSSVKHEVLKLGLRTESAKVEPNIPIDSCLPANIDELLVWPVCYTVGADIDGVLLVDELADHGVAYVGPSADVLKLNSKIVLKERLIGTHFATPAYQLLDGALPEELVIEPPCVMKTDFTCNSEGVKLVNSRDEAAVVLRDFTRRYDQRVFVEAWERKREYTIAYLPTAAGPLLAAVEMIPLRGKVYIDKVAKADNAYVRFLVPGKRMHDRLTKYAAALADFLAIDGYFRLDVLENESGHLFVIDVNFLPGMNADPAQYSYFPMALTMVHGLGFADVVCHILKYTSQRTGRAFIDEVETELAQTAGNP